MTGTPPTSNLLWLYSQLANGTNMHAIFELLLIVCLSVQSTD